MTAIPKNTPNTAGDLGSARQVIETEIEGLKALSDTLDENFTRAVETIHQMKQNGRGRLIVAGIGKSGHIAKKIVATLASTGTPSHFVHPGEASHGDLGMVTEHDAVLMISNSGENAELSDLIAYTRRFEIPLIAITSNKDSTLATHSDIPLIMPKMPEACPNGMAPTTSTTMTLALGDAIAVVLLERMGLTKEQFGVWHPGGKLGQKLLKVSDIMTGFNDLPLVCESTTMDQVILVMTEKNLGCALVSTDQNGLIGIITDGDLKRHMSAELFSKTASEIMSKDPKTISQDALAVEAMNAMTKTPGKYITSLAAVDETGQLTGMIRLQDCIQKGVA